MTAERPDDDPTHALDDFVRRMRPTASPPPAPMPDLSALGGAKAPGHPSQAGSGPAARGKPRSGRRWPATEVEDAVDISSLRQHTRPAIDTGRPELQLPAVNLVAETSQASVLPRIELPAVDMPEPNDPQAVNSTLHRASQQAAAQWQADAEAASAPAWQPDLQSLQLRPAANPRLPAQWRPGAWLGALRQVQDSRTEFVSSAGHASQAAPVVETYAPLLLLLLWPPQHGQRPLPGRWPQQVSLSALPREQALATLLGAVPDTAPLWLMNEGEPVDWALAAEIALHHEPALRPFQIEGLREFIATEREASFGRINAAYVRSGTHGAIVQR